MKIDALGVQAFVAIVEQGSFNKAAKLLFISPAGLSRRLKNFESFLGTQLIERTTRSWSITSEGQLFLPQAQRFVQDMELAICDIRDRSRNSIREVTIACVESLAYYFLPKVLSTHRKQYPNVRLKLLEMGSFEVCEAVKQHQADFGLTAFMSGYPELERKALFKDPYVFMCRKDDPLSRRRRITWKDLQDEELIAVGSNMRRKVMLDNFVQDRSFVTRHNLLDVRRPATAIGLIAACGGRAAAPRLMLTPGTYPNMVAIPLLAPVITRTIGLVKLKGRVISPPADQLHRMMSRIKLGRK